jgi:flavin reductase (DIM6/NTAB) family NADH-FMN oxidoreductase RutF
MPDVGEDFAELVRGLDYPMYVVTTAADGEKSGCLVGFTTQVSIDPPRFLVCLSEKNHTRQVAESATHFAVHFLGQDRMDLAHLFGEETGDEVDKFARCQWSAGPLNMPVLDGAAAVFVGRILQRHDLGDHRGYLLEPVHVDSRRQIADMITYAEVRDFDPGHDA